jgi:hypothetical protein
MAQRTQTYAIRLAVEGGGQVKAEVVAVGQSGESVARSASRAGRARFGLAEGPPEHQRLHHPHAAGAERKHPHNRRRGDRGRKQHLGRVRAQ